MQGVYGAASGTITADVSAQPANTQILGILNAILNAIPNGVYLDKKAMVGYLAPSMNVAMGRL